jgi:hypothetical protein
MEPIMDFLNTVQGTLLITYVAVISLMVFFTRDILFKSHKKRKFKH